MITLIHVVKLLSVEYSLSFVPGKRGVICADNISAYWPVHSRSLLSVFVVYYLNRIYTMVVVCLFVVFFFFFFFLFL